MITLFIISRIETDDPGMIPSSVRYLAVAELLIEVFIVSWVTR